MCQTDLCAAASSLHSGGTAGFSASCGGRLLLLLMMLRLLLLLLLPSALGVDPKSTPLSPAASLSCIKSLGTKKYGKIYSVIIFDNLTNI